MTRMRVRMMVTSVAVTIIGTGRVERKRDGAKNGVVDHIVAMTRTPQIVIAVAAEAVGKENFHVVEARVAAQVFLQKGEVHLANIGEMMKGEEKIVIVGVTHILMMIEIEPMIMAVGKEGMKGIKIIA